MMIDWASIDLNAARFAIFLSIFALFGLFELFIPHRPSHGSKPSRWLANLMLALIDGLFIRFLLPVVAIGAAYFAEVHQFGLFYWVKLPDIIVLGLCLIILDGMMWFQHLIFHKVPVLWRLHQVHHCDVDMDITTGLRFHPLEVGLSMLYKSAVVVLLGAPVLAVFVYETVLNGMALFNHSNVRLPKPLERILRWFVVTPDMHRIHHSVHHEETDSNYGNFLSVWDKWFRTYNAAPKDGQISMRLGLKSWRDKHSAQLLWLLINPFFKK